jgi:hypothetical protein
MNRAPYAPTYRYQDGEQSAYNAGLSYFPDYAIPTPMGGITDLLATAGGTAVAGPAGGVAANLASSVIQRWFGGSAVDQQRQERVNYVAQKAVNGNVNAMRLILSAPDNVSGNEQQMWRTAYDLIKRANPDVVRAAEQIGGDWLVNSGDSATNYPRMRAYIAAWEAQNPVQAATGAVTGMIQDFFNPPSVVPTPQIPVLVNGVPQPTASTHSGVSPALLLGGAALAALVVFGRRRRS